MTTNPVAIPQERTAPHKSGWLALAVILLVIVLSIGVLIMSGFMLDAGNMLGVATLIVSIITLIGGFIACAGFRVLAPAQAVVLTLFGNYYGTLREPGFYYVNPFVSSNTPGHAEAGVKFSTEGGSASVTASTGKSKISLRTRTLDNKKQKVNDALGNPVIIGSVVIWRVADPTRAVFAVEDYAEYLSIQCDSTIRNIARLYPYDTMENDADEKTLRGSSSEVSEIMQQELSERVKDAGLVIEDVRITNLAYADEIAAAMLQRQQATAIIAARQKIVEGAVSMVKMAIDQLSEEEVVALDEERKAAMVSNLLVVLCGNKDAQPIVNSGSIY